MDERDRIEGCHFEFSLMITTERDGVVRFCGLEQSISSRPYIRSNHYSSNPPPLAKSESTDFCGNKNAERGAESQQDRKPALDEPSRMTGMQQQGDYIARLVCISPRPIPYADVGLCVCSYRVTGGWVPRARGKAKEVSDRFQSPHLKSLADLHENQSHRS